MHPKFKPHAQSLGKVFFLDVPNEDILKYLNKKTIDAANCIVGKHEGVKELFYNHGWTRSIRNYQYERTLTGPLGKKFTTDRAIQYK
jgi:hypothetical protein